MADARLALRRLRANPGFAAVVILTLALGIGANTAIFSLVSAALLRPLPFAAPQELVQLINVRGGGAIPVRRTQSFSAADFLSIQEQAPGLAGVAAYTDQSYSLTGNGDPVRVDGAEVSASLPRVLGVAPMIGRAFLDEENEPGRDEVVLLSHGFWQQHLGGDPRVVGRTLMLSGRARTVVGVMPPGFDFPSDAELWTPLSYDSDFRSDGNRGAHFLQLVARLAPGSSLEQARTALDAVGRRLTEQFPTTNTNKTFSADDLREVMVRNVRPALLVLSGAVGLVLLIVCVNVANLLLARAAERGTEFAVRTALGAGRGRLVRQLLVESLVLALLGGALGVLLAVWGKALLARLPGATVAGLGTPALDAPVLLFSLAISLGTGLLFGLVPAWHVARGDLSGVIRAGGRGMVGSAGQRTRGVLVVAEMALGVVLLAGAGVLLQSLVRLLAVDPGFRPERVAAFDVALPSRSYDDQRAAAFFARLDEQLAGVPGIRSSGAVNMLPLIGNSRFRITFDVDGRPPAAPGEEKALDIRIATPGYLPTVGIPLRRGRLFTSADRQGSQPVALLNEAAVHEHFPNEDPIGKHIVMGWGRDSTTVTGTVVGIVGDVTQSSLDEPTVSEIWFPHAQVPFTEMSVVVQAQGDPAGLGAVVRRTVQGLDADLPVSDFRTLESVVARSVAQPRLYATLLAVFAALALLLAALGVFGVMTYAVAQRTREIGIRMALGAAGGDVVRMIVRGGLTLAGAGVVIGLGVAFVATRVLRTLLYGVSATDPATFASVAVLLVGVALVASWIPARAATRIDPNVALRAE